jgi:dynein heavy chain 2
MARVVQGVRATLAALAGADYTGQALLQLKKQALVLDLIHQLEVAEYLER